MAIVQPACAHVNVAPAESFALDLLEAVRTGLLPDQYEPSAEDWREYELWCEYEQEELERRAAEAEFPPSGFAGFGIDANEFEGR